MYCINSTLAENIEDWSQYLLKLAFKIKWIRITFSINLKYAANLPQITDTARYREHHTNISALSSLKLLACLLNRIQTWDMFCWGTNSIFIQNDQEKNIRSQLTKIPFATSLVGQDVVSVMQPDALRNSICIHLLPPYDWLQGLKIHIFLISFYARTW